MDSFFILSMNFSLWVSILRINCISGNYWVVITGNGKNYIAVWWIKRRASISLKYRVL